jgi:hypothetical protein
MLSESVPMQEILVADISDLTEIVAGLTQRGLAFCVRKVGSYWRIEITGF